MQDSARKESFKQGISASDKTQTRKDQGESIRKQKREDKLLAKRRVKSKDEYLSGQSFIQILQQHFNRAAFLAGNAEMLNVVHKLLCVMDAKKDWTEEHSNALGVDVMNGLMRYCTVPDLQMKKKAIACIANLCSVDDPRPSEHFLQNNYLQLMSNHLINSPDHHVHVYAYEALYNMILTVPREWIAQILASQFMGGFNAPTLELEGPENDIGGTIECPFFNDMFGIFYVSSPDPQLMSVVLALLASIYETPAYTPPFLFTHSIWRVIHTTLLMIQPRAKDTMDDAQRSAYDCVTSIVMRAAEQLADNLAIDKIPFFTIHKQGEDSFFMRMRMLYMTCNNLKIQQRLSTAIAVIAGATEQRDKLHYALEESKCVPDLIMNMLESGNELLRVNAVALAGYYASDGAMSVNNLLKMRVLPILFRFISQGPQGGGTKPVLQAACRAYMNMFRACDLDRKNSMELTKPAQNIMLTLIQSHKLLSLMCSFLPFGIQVAVTDLDLTLDILSLIEQAIAWDKEIVKPILEDSGFIADQLPVLIAHKLTSVHKIAGRIDDALEGRAPEPDYRAQFAQQQQQQQPFLNLAPGTFMGKFAF
jgi:hypothetical protein